ncbi:lytic transglycosylase domain-containing protein [Leptolyngbya sp. FACHB-402]|nr:lytic transglycosylase domain-containing protein [Leptolyngbya sp. FACHB-161]MBD2375737.1 lytic transglycosylase domain-containing protein [Leptolyngbya sp. FACHB-238]MBD2401086.1 lytic transglycosylase domain-containing protein [Leptolyngbya sp. FACHB-239]MBD2406671.1 lytic transglycosylase domain-containing protein [Leptolyngbya sp. FACHB-402]
MPEITSILVFAIASPLVTNSPVYAADIVDSFSTFISLEIKPQTQIAPEVMLIRQAIIGQESGANFQAVNRHSGALGYAQVMPENLPQWSKEALGFSVSRKDFLASPELQIAIVDFKLNQYWQKSIVASRGNVAIAIQRVAAWWYSGKPEKYTSTKTQYYAGHRYPSIAAYSQSILRRYQLILNAQNPSQPQRGV